MWLTNPDHLEQPRETSPQEELEWVIYDARVFLDKAEDYRFIGDFERAEEMVRQAADRISTWRED